MRAAPLHSLPQRADFLRAASHGRKTARAGFVVQILRTTPGAPIRLGLTASRKVGNAVIRNRARRRLRALACEELLSRKLSGADIVLIARKGTAEIDFATLRADFRAVLDMAFPPPTAPAAAP
ncbi:MAG: ribonuclease P protein component [Acidiphilium sp. 37-67-22]|nr:MAG: ribonuclease P protein component [Acidiphilium sp. 37-67-22]HQT72499.1 ribonuclease P protein component [Acidiphilium sp.]